MPIRCWRVWGAAINSLAACKRQSPRLRLEGAGACRVRGLEGWRRFSPSVVKQVGLLVLWYIGCLG